VRSPNPAFQRPPSPTTSASPGCLAQRGTCAWSCSAAPFAPVPARCSENPPSACSANCTETSLDVARVKRAMIATARRTVVLADHTKFREPAFATICTANEVSAVITTRKAGRAALSQLRETGIEVHLADGSV
jgi:hypothetical protein